MLNHRAIVDLVCLLFTGHLQSMQPIALWTPKPLGLHTMPTRGLAALATQDTTVQTKECPACHEPILEFEHARFNPFITRVSTRMTALAELNACATELAPVLQLFLQQHTIGAIRTLLLAKEHELQRQADSLEETKQYIASKINELKRKETALNKQLATLKKEIQTAHGKWEKNTCEYTAACNELDSLEDHVAAGSTPLSPIFFPMPH